MGVLNYWSLESFKASEKTYTCFLSFGSHSVKVGIAMRCGKLKCSLPQKVSITLRRRLK